MRRRVARRPSGRTGTECGAKWASGMLDGGFFVADDCRRREGEEGGCGAEQGRNMRVYVRLDGSSANDGGVAVRRCDAGSRQGYSNAKRHHGQSRDGFLELHVARESVIVVVFGM